MIPLPPKVKLVLGVLIAGLLSAGGYWTKALADAGTSIPSWLPPILSILVFLEGFVTVPPAASKKIIDLTSKLAGLSVVAVLVGGLIIGGASAGCKGAQFPSLDKVEQVVLDDLMSCGTSAKCISQMETDVATLVAQGLLGPDAGTDAVVLVKDALQALIDFGVLPPDVLPKARAALQTEKIKLAAPCGAGQ